MESSLISQRVAILMIFLELRREPGVCSRVMLGVAIKTFVCSTTSGLLSSYDVHLRNLTTLSRTIRTHLDVKQETEVHFLVGTVILGFLSIFRKSKDSSPFEALNSVCLSRCQSDMIAPVQMRRRPTAFSRASTGDSDIPSSCDMKQEPKFKPLQGNPAFL